MKSSTVFSLCTHHWNYNYIFKQVCFELKLRLSRSWVLLVKLMYKQDAPSFVNEECSIVQEWKGFVVRRVDLHFSLVDDVNMELILSSIDHLYDIRHLGRSISRMLLLEKSIPLIK